jgi:hypothetical protein
MYMYMQQFRSSGIRRNVTFQKSRILDYIAMINSKLAYILGYKQKSVNSLTLQLNVEYIS